MKALLAPLILLILIGLAMPITFKLLGIIHWSWFWVLSPYWVGVLIVSLVTFIYLAIWAWNYR